MLEKWIEYGPEGTRDVVDDTAALALHVLTYAGFGIPHDFNNEAQQMVNAPHKLTYRDALLTVLRNFTLLVLMPTNLMNSVVIPQAVRNVGEACQEFKLYMREMVEKEKATAPRRPEAEANNLLSALVRASEAASEGQPNKAYSGRAGLADDELYGNLFIYNMAGHETTANTLATAIAYLAAQPQWQSWVREEIRNVASESSSQLQVGAWEYGKVYPQLVRCQAVMLETLRIHGSTVFLPKSTGNSGCALTIVGKEHNIPSGTFVVVNSQALHCDRDTWGADALDFRPSRWMKNTSQLAGQEELFEPPPGTFVGWADGPRICPGKKFSQVEFVGVMAVLFRQHQVRPKQEQGESEEQTSTKLERVIEDSGISAITLQMRHPQRVALVWTEME